MFNWMPYKEQGICEKRLTKVMKRLKIDYFNFNWDRNSCFIEFTYQEEAYKLKHSIEKAKKRGVILKNGMDCLVDLTQSLEDLCGIIERGTYNFDTWIAGMKQPSEKAVIQERVHIKYKSFGQQEPPDFIRNERLIPFASGSTVRNFDTTGQGRQFKLIKKNSN
ncbi:hypothetical protein [Jeotgalibacillus campisalis]|uniref:Uncharacterized protein n=1 Tax=Jeotgalibacillus campisalis TaxID=220754 RepID=A0A0C2VFE4_9BACL|nr:hypothetical protein [Jeotgalibacillus campisalis]KIL43261.1 hypothetical protein KR50_36640 [Jeotgalibacillus campisalis]